MAGSTPSSMVLAPSTSFRRSIKVGCAPAETMIMSHDEWSGSSPAPGVNQFGTPVNQFGTPASFGAPQTGMAAPFGVPSYGRTAPAPARRPAGAAVLMTAAALAVLVAAGLLLRFYVFPDLSKPIALPGMVAGVSSMGATGSQPVTLQSKDAEGRAMVVGVYADDALAPRTMLVVTAGRVKDLNTAHSTEATATAGKVTCTENIDAATLLQQAAAAARANAASMRAFTAGAACWRTGRHLTVLVVALTADGAAQAAARQAVTQSWQAI